MNTVDVVVVGAGAAGMMCAAEAAKRGRSVLVIDHAKAVGEKIRISGGGRCNFTNLHAAPENFLSENPRFCISALSRYRPADIVALLERHGIAWHEKTLGQLFCDGSAMQVVELREKHGLTQIQLAERSGIDQGDISRIERGSAMPNEKTLIRIADALNADLMLVPRSEK